MRPIKAIQLGESDFMSSEKALSECQLLPNVQREVDSAKFVVYWGNIVKNRYGPITTTLGIARRQKLDRDR